MDVRNIKSAFSNLLKNQNSLDVIKKLAYANLDKAYVGKKTAQGKSFSVRDYAIGIAVEAERIDVLEWLIDEMQCPDIKDADHHPLLIAVKNKKEALVKWLLQRDAEKDVISEYIEACVFKDSTIFLEMLLRKNNYSNALKIQMLAIAAKYANLNVMKWLIDDLHGQLNIHPLENHPAIMAIQYHKMDVLEWLIAKGVVDGIEAFCIQASIFYNNVDALKVFFKMEQFAFQLGNQPFVDANENHDVFNENMTTYMIKHQRLNIFMWYLDNCAFQVKEDLLDKNIDTMSRLYTYFEELDMLSLRSLRSSFRQAFKEAKITKQGYAVKFLDELDVIIDGKVKAATAITIPRGSITPDTAPVTPITTYASGSPVNLPYLKEAFFKMDVIDARLQRLSREQAITDDEKNEVTKISQSMLSNVRGFV